MTQINAYVKFNGNCQEAMAFYKECLGGELTVQTVAESPMAGQMPPEMKDRVLHSSLNRDGIALMASDMIGAESFVNGNNVYLCLICSSKAEIESTFSKLSRGGQVIHPLKEEFFGTFGDLTDKFGMNWMFQFNNQAAQ